MPDSSVLDWQKPGDTTQDCRWISAPPCRWQLDPGANSSKSDMGGSSWDLHQALQGDLTVKFSRSFWFQRLGPLNGSRTLMTLIAATTDGELPMRWHPCKCLERGGPRIKLEFKPWLSLVTRVELESPASLFAHL